MGVIDASAYVHPTAVVCGDVSLGPRASVWPTAVVRGDSADVGVEGPEDVGVECPDEGGDVIRSSIGDVAPSYKFVNIW